MRSAAQKALPRVPSWGRVLATTISLWTARRLPRPRRPRLALFLAVCVLAAAAAVTVSAVRLTGTSHRAAQVASPAAPHRAPARAGGPAAAAGTVAAVRSQAAAWIAGQVGSDQTIACDPLMCAALGAHGVASGRLMPLEPAGASTAGASTAGTGTAGANVVVTSPVDRAQASPDAPVLLASFGAGAGQVQVRAAVPDGAAYQAALRADLTARRSAGAQLLHSRQIQASAQAAGQLRAGQVDARLLIMLAMLASQHSWRVVAFGAASPGVPLEDVPFRQVVIAGTDGRAVAAALALVRAQRAPYAPAQATIVRLADGQPGLRIDFAAPGPLGLLTGGTPG